MIAIKNNKDKFSFLGNYAEVRVGSQLLGWVFKHEAYTTRKNHQGGNGWNIFNFVPNTKSTEVFMRQVEGKPNENCVKLGRYNGHDIFAEFIIEQKTIMGKTYCQANVKLEHKILYRSDIEEFLSNHEDYKFGVHWGGEFQLTFVNGEDGPEYVALKSYYRPEEDRSQYEDVTSNRGNRPGGQRKSFITAGDFLPEEDEIKIVE